MTTKPSAANRKRRIFIADDHPLVREWLANLINQQSDLAVCGEAATAAEALQEIAALKPEVVIVDITLKGSSGIELIKDLKQSCPTVAILVLSMHDESLYAERALRAGARGYIMKREATQKIIAALRKVLEGKLYMSEEVTEKITTQFIEGKVPTPRSPIDLLSDRELTVFEALGDGSSTREIAVMLRISIKSVQVYCARIKEKLNLNSGNELLREALRNKDAKKPR
jgi:DNA-binding NarL/FixJ family response regulator